LAGEFRITGIRYFSAQAMAGRLYVTGIGDGGPWDAAQLTFWDEDAVDLLATPRLGYRKIQTGEELETAVQESARGLPIISLWIREGLEGVTRRIWRGEDFGKTSDV